jgi:hypothetical protein
MLQTHYSVTDFTLELRTEITQFYFAALPIALMLFQHRDLAIRFQRVIAITGFTFHSGRTAMKRENAR